MAAAYTATITLTAEQICDAICTAVEGGITYWAGSIECLHPHQDLIPHPAEGNTIWYGRPALYEMDDFIIRVTTDDEDGNATHDLTPAKINAGLKVMSEKHAEQFADLVNEQGDAWTADVFLQCCLFNEVVFG